ncbi:antA/AntB antirepressor family protein [Ligilactobacillus apodemi]|uniref:antA/AntB antirepressor family protein n=1 Tax=Ligilactobacillus apodemi TaxID=307126 RepID=UPI00214C4F27|nr:antA/AntB antirepressor family protein [Ligilactobacillus apodemi]MCR1900905.1 antA/AntB antirepressor family protein [Ligilactobacillus apodemi]
MDELVPVQKQKDGSVVVSGRDLHDFLDVKTKYADWFKRMSEYGFDENIDFAVFLKNEKDDTAFGGYRKITDHALTLDMAKEISMIQRTERGKQARQYFIEVEKRYKDKQQSQLPTSPTEMLKLAINSTLETADKVEALNTRMDEFEQNAPIDPGEYNYLSKRISSEVQNYVVSHHMILNQKQRSQLYKDVNRGVKEVTGVKTRSQLRKKDFDVVDRYLMNWTPSPATLMIIEKLSDEDKEQTLFL